MLTVASEGAGSEWVSEAVGEQDCWKVLCRQAASGRDFSQLQKECLKPKQNPKNSKSRTVWIDVKM